MRVEFCTERRILLDVVVSEQRHADHGAVLTAIGVGWAIALLRTSTPEEGFAFHGENDTKTSAGFLTLRARGQKTTRAGWLSTCHVPLITVST